jgi:branched-chain amino acid transport system substrate-binding protein
MGPGIWAALSGCAFGLLAAVAGGPAQAQISDNVVRIGVINDMSGPFADVTGPGGVLGAQMAAEDFGGSVNGARIDIVSGDHQNKADVASALARRWFETEGVDAIAEVPISAAAIAVLEVARTQNKAFLISGGALSDFTGKLCSPISVHWADDSLALAQGNARAVVESGGKSWFFITSDYAFGRSMERDASAVVTAAGGTVVGVVRHPLGTQDFSSYLLQAQSSKAQVIGLANVATETVNTIKQAREFGIVGGGQRLAAFLFFVNDVRGVGLNAAQGLYLTTSFYWDYDDATRAFAKRFYDRIGKMPNHEQAANYSAVLHYLKAIKAAGTDDAKTVVRKMKELPVEDFFTKGKVQLRKDGRLMNDLILFEVKSPAESKGEWDLYKPIKRIPAGEAYRPLGKSECPLLNEM